MEGCGLVGYGTSCCGLARYSTSCCKLAVAGMFSTLTPEVDGVKGAVSMSLFASSIGERSVKGADSLDSTDSQLALGGMKV